MYQIIKMEPPLIVLCPVCKAKNAALIDAVDRGELNSGDIINRIVHCIDCIGGEKGVAKMVEYMEECFRNGSIPRLQFKL